MTTRLEWLQTVLDITDPAQLGPGLYAVAVFVGVPVGATIATALVLRSPTARLIAAALLGAITALLFVAARNLAWLPALELIVAGMLVGVGLSLAARVLASGRATPLREWYARVLSPALWQGLERPLDGRDAVKRWYVAIAAGIGAVIGALLTDSSLIDTALTEWAKPTSLLATLAMTAVYLVLAGPLHERIVGATTPAVSARDDDDTPASRLNDMASRSIVRMLLVLLAFFALDFVFHCVDESMRSGKWGTFAIITFDGVVPAVVTYYCSAALQGASDCVRRRVQGPILLMGMTLTYPGLVVMTWLISGPPWPAVIAALLLDIPMAALITAFQFSIYGLAASLSLDHVAGRREMTALLLALLAAAVVVQGVMGLGMNLLADRSGTPLAKIWPLADAVRPFLTLAGWAVGLYASGFPRLVEQRRMARTASGPVAPQSATSVRAADISELAP